MSVSVVLLSGGKGTRVGGPLPKQYLLLHGKPIACHSLEVFVAHPDVTQAIVVCAPEYRSFFARYSVQFAEPGERRQDSLYNGLQLVTGERVLVHDAARPFITPDLITRLLETKDEAATLAIPVAFTVKEADPDRYVRITLDRSALWEIQTPQLLSKSLLEKGFAHAHAHQITVTDDVSLAELLDHPVKLVTGSKRNIKITTPEDVIACTSIS